MAASEIKESYKFWSMVLQRQNIEDPQAPWIGLGQVQTFHDREVVRVKVVAGIMDLVHQGTVEHQ